MSKGIGPGENLRIKVSPTKVMRTKAVVVEAEALTVHQGDSFNGLAIIHCDEDLAAGEYRYEYDNANRERVSYTVTLATELGDYKESSFMS